MIYDCFLFFKELDLLEIRFNILDEFVDKFVLVESSKTFSNKPKPLYFLENKERYSKFLHKIEYKQVNFNDSNPWNNEKIQRNHIVPDKFNENDLLILSDLDEIPNPDLLTMNFELNKIYYFNQKIYYYNFSKRIDMNWYGSRLCSGKMIKAGLSVDIIRNAARSPIEDNTHIILQNGGWHFSFLGDVEFMKEKIEAYSHQEYNNDFIKNNISMNLLLEDRDLFNRPMKFITEPISLNTHPKYLVENYEKYNILHECI